MDGLSHSLWVEKYRPTDLSTYIGNEHLKEKVKRYGLLPESLKQNWTNLNIQVPGYSK